MSTRECIFTTGWVGEGVEDGIGLGSIAYLLRHGNCSVAACADTVIPAEIDVIDKGKIEWIGLVGEDGLQRDPSHIKGDSKVRPDEDAINLS